MGEFEVGGKGEGVWEEKGGSEVMRMKGDEKSDRGI